MLLTSTKGKEWRWSCDLFWKEFWKEFCDFFEMFTCLTLFHVFFLISALVWWCAQSGQTPSKRFLFNKHPGRLIFLYGIYHCIKLIKSTLNIHVCYPSFQTNIKIVINKAGIRLSFQMHLLTSFFYYFRTFLLRFCNHHI